MAKDIILQLAIRSVRLHLLRSILAALGIVIGVVAIASMGMMGANMTLSVTDQLSDMANILVVREYTGGGERMFSSGGGGGPVLYTSTGSSSDQDWISEAQFKDILRIASSYGTVYAVYSQTDRIEIGDRQGRTTLYGLDTAVMPEILTLQEGSYPRSTSQVMIGPSLADRYGLTIGSRIDIGNATEGATTVRVSGILEERGMSLDLNTDSAIIGGEKLYTGIYGGEGEYDQVNIALNDISEANLTSSAITDELNKKSEVVTVQDSSRMMDTITSTLSSLTTFVIAIAGISLLVAAVSIFNVMMMSVTERIREIGILRSIGTQRGEVRRMFLYEAGILGMVGAGIGAVASLILGYMFVLAMVGTTTYFFALQSLVYILYAMLVGIGICIISGVYPAWRASNLDPIEALRAE